MTSSTALVAVALGLITTPVGMCGTTRPHGGRIPLRSGCAHPASAVIAGDPAAQSFDRDVEHHLLGAPDQEVRDGCGQVDDEVEPHHRLVANPGEVVLAVLTPLL